MASTKASSPRVRWECPSGEHPAVLGPRRPRLKSLVRYCLPCSIRDGVLVERSAPALDRKRHEAKVRAAAKAKAKRDRAAAELEARARRTHDRFQVAGVDLRDEVRRYSRLPVFGGARGKLAKRPPRFDVTHREYTGRQRGFASPWEWRIHVTLYPEISLDDVRRTIVHELCHLHVGQNGTGEWHGAKFKATLGQALREAELRPTHDRRDVVLSVDD